VSVEIGAAAPLGGWIMSGSRREPGPLRLFVEGYRA
jgi:hypothetical protein